MKVAVRINDRSFTVEVDSDELVENLKSILEVEANVPAIQQQLWFKGEELPNSVRLSAAGILEDSMLTLVMSTFSSAEELLEGWHGSIRANGSAADPVEILSQLRGDPVAMAELEQSHPTLARSVLENDVESLQEFLHELQRRKLIRGQQEHENVCCFDKGARAAQQEATSTCTGAYRILSDLLFADPFDVDAQRRIEEDIRQRNVNDNWEAAIEYNPEAFGRVIMLFVDMEVNGCPLKAFVDSGAQSTIISMHCAKRCGLLRLLDRRYVGVAKGVGQTVIVGRVHVAAIKIGRNYYPCSFTVLEHADIEFIFGLDMLRKHQCSIDLKDNVLRIGGGEIAVPFLQEKDLPQHLHDEAQLGKTPPPTEGTTNGPGLTIHPPAAFQAPLVQGRQPSGTEASRVDRRTSRSPQRETECAKVQRLLDLGFDRSQVLEALSLFNGNEDHAAGYLFGS
ncbi:protein DNA-DAMAGE INDUCIBLE 1 isoform X2 [Physcomitrium patens]|uniref:protein DNA-DAMAGE INDUCIBLE 1 isoform X2 n=1 Tax=Physcomitrium patens TaxID=3218 RepID=UPI000D17E328|nr:UBA domain-containing protein mud1-like isoform X2 [Physcomitrium patens]|eukprot:XP_024400321.1 UBA domain-containing protein mud1-like isoform X2 [Physcomitrella patens]